jgi:histidine ammonia-lyase
MSAPASSPPVALDGASLDLEAVHARVRERVPAHGKDRVLGPEIEALARLLRTGGDPGRGRVGLR